MIALATIIHNGGLVMGLGAIAICFALVAFWPETLAPRGGYKVFDQEKEDDDAPR